MVGLLSLESCCGRPKMRNSVLEGLRDRKFYDIQLAKLVIVWSNSELSINRPLYKPRRRAAAGRRYNCVANEVQTLASIVNL